MDENQPWWPLGPHVRLACPVRAKVWPQVHRRRGGLGRAGRAAGRAGRRAAWGLGGGAGGRVFGGRVARIAVCRCRAVLFYRVLSGSRIEKGGFLNCEPGSTASLEFYA